MNNSIHYELMNAHRCMEVASKLAERERDSWTLFLEYSNLCGRTCQT